MTNDTMKAQLASLQKLLAPPYHFVGGDKKIKPDEVEEQLKRMFGMK